MEEPRDEGERPGYPPPPAETDLTGGSLTDEPGATPNPEAKALADEADEIRRLVDAGAGSPEALRDLAARLREHRAREEALWRMEVKPALVKEGKGRLRGTPRLPAPPGKEPQSSHLGPLAVLLVGLVLAVLIAANTTVWVLVLPLIGVLVWAWSEGRDSTP